MIFVAVEKPQPTGHRFERGSLFPIWTLSHLFSGRMELEMNGRKYSVSAPLFGLIPPHVSYQVNLFREGRTPVREFFCFFSPPVHLAPLLKWPEAILSHLGEKSPELQRIRARLRDVEACFRQPRRLNYQHWAWNALEEALLILGEQWSVAQETKSDERIIRIVQHIQTDYATPLSVDNLARFGGLSPSHFAHLFRDEMKISPMQYLERVRLHAAAEMLLSSSATAAEIAAEVGFENASHFTQRFSRRYGLPPRQFRNAPSAPSLLLKERNRLPQG